MKIPVDSIIPEEKFTRYLLVKRDFDDKSGYLSRGGYSEQNYAELMMHIRLLIRENDAIKERTDEYGTFFRVTGTLPGVDQGPLEITTIWLKRKFDNKFQFITLIPTRRK